MPPKSMDATTSFHGNTDPSWMITHDHAVHPHPPNPMAVWRCLKYVGQKKWTGPLTCDPQSPRGSSRVSPGCSTSSAAWSNTPFSGGFPSKIRLWSRWSLHLVENSTRLLTGGDSPLQSANLNGVLCRNSQDIKTSWSQRSLLEPLRTHWSLKLMTSLACEIITSPPKLVGPPNRTGGYVQMVVSWNRGTPSHHPFLDGIFSINHPLWGYPHLWKPPNMSHMFGFKRP